MIDLIVSTVILAFVGITILGHVLVLHAMFAKRDEDGRATKTLPPRGNLSRA